MDFYNVFEEFWSEKSYQLVTFINNPTRFHNNLSSKMREFQSLMEIDEYVMNLKTARESTRRIIVLFYRYLMDKGIEREIDSPLFLKRYYDYPFERQLEIAKYLHTPKTPGEIAEHFDIDSRTVRADLQQLEEGIEIFGTTIMIEEVRNGRQISYTSTVHPIFLPLNLTEVYSMTVFLDKVISSEEPNAKIIHNISKRIKSQLSDYAWEKLYPGENKYIENNDYMSDEKLAKSREGILGYLMKSGNKCRFIWKGKEYIGRVVEEEKYGYPYSVVTEDGVEFDAPLSEIDFIVDDLKYE